MFCDVFDECCLDVCHAFMHMLSAFRKEVAPSRFFVFCVHFVNFLSEASVLSMWKSSSWLAWAFPSSLFGAGLPLQVIGGRGATGMRPQEKKIFDVGRAVFEL